jgi:H+/gluconate symporter-like permease
MRVNSQATLLPQGCTLPISNPYGLLLLLPAYTGPIFSHINDAGFRLVKEYFGLSIGETIKSWSTMESIISVAGVIGVQALVSSY